MPIAADLLELLSEASDQLEAIMDSDAADIAKDALKEAKGHVSKFAPNPHMVSNGHAEKAITGSDCPKCKKYFRARTLKKVGGAIFSGIGGALSSQTAGVNVAGALRHGRAEVKTIAHLVKLKEQAKGIKQSEFLTKLMSVVLTMKAIKAANQGGLLAADLIPVPIVDSVIGATVNKGAKRAQKGMKGAVKWASIELHWRAFQEAKIARGAGTGPAMRMVRELFNQAFFKFPWESGALAADQYIMEPAGWMVIQDKLNLI